MPRMRNSLILVIAILCGMIASILSLRLINKSAPLPKGTVTAVAVVRDIQAGDLIKKEDLDLLEAPLNINAKVLFGSIDAVAGKVCRGNLLKGSFVRHADILEEGDNLASLIPKGYRAMTIPVKVPSNLISFLQIGNRVDVILTFEASGSGGKNEVVTVTLVKNAKVIGVPPKSKDGAFSGAADTQITLAVTPDGAETLAYSIKKGVLTLAIHSASDESEGVEEKFFTLKELFSQDDGLGPVQMPKDEIEIYRGLRKEHFRYGENGQEVSL